MENQGVSISQKPSKVKGYFAKVDKSVIVKSVIIVAGVCILIGGKPVRANAGVLSDYILKYGSVNVLTKSGVSIIVRGRYIVSYIRNLHPIVPVPETVGYGIGSYGPLALGIGVGCGLAGLCIDSIVKK